MPRARPTAGITEDILTDLSKIKGLRVASRNAVSRYRGAPADIPKVASELGVGAVRFLPALINLAALGLTMGDVAGAERFVRRSLEIDPQDAFSTVWLALLMKLTRRDDQVLAAASRLRQLSSETFYVTAVHLFRIWVHLSRGDIASAEQAVRDGRAEGGEPSNLRAAEAEVAVHAGRLDEAPRAVRELENAPAGAESCGGAIPAAKGPRRPSPCMAISAC